jgi:hypothetical protein
VLATGGAQYDVTAGHTLDVAGGAAQVGFDGSDHGIAILDFQAGSDLTIGSDGGQLGSIQELHTGAFGDTQDVQSGIDLGGTTLALDLSQLSAAAVQHMDLMSSDELIGLFSGVSIDGLGSHDATVTVDYIHDQVTLDLKAGTGQVSMQTVGQETYVDNGEQDLWNALTTGHGIAGDEQVIDPALEEDPVLVAMF